MVRDYVEELYEPTARQAERLAADDFKPARELAAWKARVLAAWEGVDILSVETDVSVASLGTDRSVEAEVTLGSMSADDVEVQLVHGTVGQHDELEHPTITTMTPVGNVSGSVRYRGTFSCSSAGRYGFTVRVVPSHPDLISSIELGRVAWA
jgi:starch phosphorylase